jgi:hypothetical protein
MANRSTVGRLGSEKKVGLAANGSASCVQRCERSDAAPRPPANDNIGVQGLPTCLAVTDDEVMLLHRYLSREILGLFSEERYGRETCLT